MTVLDLRPRLAANRGARYMARLGLLPSIPANASEIYAANLRLTLLPLTLTQVWFDETRRFFGAYNIMR